MDEALDAVDRAALAEITPTKEALVRLDLASLWGMPCALRAR
jgi:hypothetical protein